MWVPGRLTDRWCGISLYMCVGGGGGGGSMRHWTRRLGYIGVLAPLLLTCGCESSSHMQPFAPEKMVVSGLVAPVSACPCPAVGWLEALTVRIHAHRQGVSGLKPAACCHEIAHAQNGQAGHPWSETRRKAWPGKASPLKGSIAPLSCHIPRCSNFFFPGCMSSRVGNVGIALTAT